ncbi:RNA-directed DNA polymerase, eukaryota, partial [Tanacetum coccineum]
AIDDRTVGQTEFVERMNHIQQFRKESATCTYVLRRQIGLGGSRITRHNTMDLAWCTWTERPYEASLFPGIGFGLFLRSLGGRILTLCQDVRAKGQSQVDSFYGAYASQKVTEACKGFLGPDGDWPSSAKAQGSLTARPTRRAGTKVGLSDPTVPSGRAVAQRIKVTLRITRSSPRAHIDGKVWHLDVGSSPPGAVIWTLSSMGEPFVRETCAWQIPWCIMLNNLCKRLRRTLWKFLREHLSAIGDGNGTRFWLDKWFGDKPLMEIFPCLFVLELDKEILVADKMKATLDLSFRRHVRNGSEHQQLEDLYAHMEVVSLSQSKDRWVCDLSGDGVFQVSVIRNFLDNLFLPSHSEPTRWIKYIPIKINVFAWRARHDYLPTRANLNRRGIILESSMCTLCHSEEEDINHVLFRCDLAKTIFSRICRWWDLDWHDIESFSDWFSLFSLIRLTAKSKSMLEGVFCVAWWSIWGLRNRIIFNETPPRRSVIFDDIVSFSFMWCSSRCNRVF